MSWTATWEEAQQSSVLTEEPEVPWTATWEEAQAAGPDRAWPAPEPMRIVPRQRDYSKFHEAVESPAGFRRTIPKKVWDAPPPPKANIAAWVRSALGSFERGLVGQGVGGALKGIALGAKLIGEDRPVGELATFKVGQWVQDFVDYLAPEMDPRLRGSFWADVLPGGAGSMLAFMGPAGAAKAAGGGVMTTVALLGAGMEGAGQYDEAKAHGASEEDALSAAGWGGVTGLSEAVPMGRIFDRLSGGAGRKGLVAMIRAAIPSALEEGGQEAFQQIAGNAIAREYYDPHRDITAGLVESTGAGGILGFLANLGAAAIGAKVRRRRTKEFRLTPEGARDFVEKSPEIAEQIAEKQTPSRTLAAKTTGNRQEWGNIEDRQHLAKEMRDAREVRKDEEQVPAPGPVEEGRAEEGRPAVQQPAEARPEAGRAEVPQEEIAPAEPAILAKAELDEALSELSKYTEGRLFAAPMLDPQLLKLTAKVIVKAVKAGAYKFADFINNLAKKIGSARVRSFGPALEQSWAEIQKGGEHPDMEPVGKVDEVLTAEAEEPPTPRPELAVPAKVPEARKIVRDVDAIREKAGVPERRRDVDVEREAVAAVKKDGLGERQRFMDKVASGEGIGDLDIAKAKEIMNSDRIDALRSGDLQAIADAQVFAEAYRQTGTETARAFRWRRDPVQGPAERMGSVITTSIFEPTRKERTETESVEDELRQAKQSGDTAGIERLNRETERLRKKHAAEILRIRKKLKALGYDLSKLDEYLEDEVSAVRLLKAIETVRSGGWDKIYEYWRNAILSAATTQSANITGNFGNMAWHFTAQRLVETLANSVRKDPKGPQWQEFKYILAGFLPGISRGMGNALKTWKTETPWLEHRLQREARQKIEERGVHIAGKTGKAVRSPQRVLGVVDDFAKSVVCQMEVGALACRYGMERGLKGEALTRHIQDEMADFGSRAWQEAYEIAIALAFQTRGGKVAEAVLRARRSLPVFRYLTPFVITPARILDWGIRKSPLGSLGMLWRFGTKGYKNKNRPRLGRDMAEQIIAWSGVIALFAYMDDEDGNPQITGALDKDHPFSFKWNNNWYSYARIEPLATALGTTIDWMRGLQSAEPRRIVRLPFDSLLGQVKSKTFLSGIADLLKVFDRGTDYDIVNYATKFTTSWWPNIFKSAGRSIKDVIPERGFWGKDAEWTTRAMRRLIQKTELGLIPDYPRYDIWGQTLDRTKGPIPNTDIPYRMIVPIHIREAETFVGARMLVNWNNKVPEDEEVRPQTPVKYYTAKDGTKRWMTDVQYDEFAKLAGETARALVLKEARHADNPTKRDIDYLKDRITAARAMAKGALIKQWSGGELAQSSPELAVALHQRSIVKYAGYLSRRKPRLPTVDEKEKDQARYEAQLRRRKKARAALPEAIARWEKEQTEARDWFRDRPEIGRDAILGAMRAAEKKMPYRLIQELDKLKGTE